jgi:hypothetical protein
MNKTPAQDGSGFAYGRADFEELVDFALAHARNWAPPTPAPRRPKAAA